jgi:hypothetical protein
LSKCASERTVTPRVNAWHSGVAEEGVLRALEALGLSDETVSLLHIVPLVHVAWIDGTVSARAADHIIVVARERKIEDKSEAYRLLAEWLGSEPSEALFPDALEAIGIVLQQQTSVERRRYVQTLLQHSATVAAASGGILGFAKVSNREREALDHIRRVLEHAPDHKEDRTA